MLEMSQQSDGLGLIMKLGWAFALQNRVDGIQSSPVVLVFDENGLWAFNASIKSPRFSARSRNAHFHDNRTINKNNEINELFVW